MIEGFSFLISAAIVGILILLMFICMFLWEILDNLKRQRMILHKISKLMEKERA